jgi:DnaJ-class molecular chaperone
MAHRIINMVSRVMGKTVRKCRDCNGAGMVSDGTGSDKKILCPACGGTGYKLVPGLIGYRVVKCKDCNGAGMVSDGTVSGKKIPCPACGGTGVQRV